MSDDQGQEKPSVEDAPVVGLNGKPVLYPPGTWGAAVDPDTGKLATDADGRLVRAW